MTRLQTTQSREGACSLLGDCFVRLAGGLQDERFSFLLPLPVRARRSSVGYSMPPRLSPLSKIDDFGCHPSLMVNVRAAVMFPQTSFGRRPSFFFNRCEQALQSLIQRFWFLHCAFSNALQLPQPVNTMQEPKTWESFPKIKVGEK